MGALLTAPDRRVSLAGASPVTQHSQTAIAASKAGTRTRRTRWMLVSEGRCAGSGTNKHWRST